MALPMPRTACAGEACPPLPHSDALGPRSASCQDLLEDLDLQILMERLKLLQSQREMAALRCARFYELLEESVSLSRSTAACDGGPSAADAAAATATEEDGDSDASGVYPCSTLFPMYSAEEREFVERPRYTARRARQRGSSRAAHHRARRSHRRQPSWPCAGLE